MERLDILQRDAQILPRLRETSQPPHVEGQTGEGSPKKAPNKAIITSLPSPPSLDLSASINDVFNSCLMDTGAAVTLMSQDVWKKVAYGWILEPWSGSPLVGAVGTPMDALGTARVSLLINYSFACSKSFQVGVD